MDTRQAIYRGTCPACTQTIEQGSSIVRHAYLPVWVHATGLCPTMAVNPNRYSETAKLHPKRSRKVAMSLGVTVTRSGKYLDHQTICFQAARVTCSDSRWLASIALATGKQVSENGEIGIVLGGSQGGAGGQGGSSGGSAGNAQQAASQGGQTTAQAAMSQSLVEAAVKAQMKAQGDEVSAVVKAAVKAAMADIDAKIEAAAKQPAKEITVRVGDQAAVKVEGLVHFKFATLLKMVGAGVNVWIAGPAGSGKTTAVESAAKALDLAFFFNGAIDTEYKLSGFVDAHGKIVSTSFRRAYTEGGVYLFDEVDASMPGALLAFNAAMANGHCDFPGSPEPVVRHKDFRCVAAGNTWGMGATTEYVGRNKMDAAFLDRFVQLDWPYDESLEATLATDSSWCKTVQKLRAKAKQRGMKVVISPRATINGCKLLAAGFSTEETLEATVFAKLSATDRTNLMAS